MLGLDSSTGNSSVDIFLAAQNPCKVLQRIPKGILSWQNEVKTFSASPNDLKDRTLGTSKKYPPPKKKTLRIEKNPSKVEKPEFENSIFI